MIKRLINAMVDGLLSVKTALAVSPRVALEEIPFLIFPQIVQRGEQYYLRYQIGVEPGDDMQLRMFPFSRTTREKAYYFFGVSTSFPERGTIVERPLDRDGLTDFARRNAVYWLDPDGSETHIEIKQE